MVQPTENSLLVSKSHSGKKREQSAFTALKGGMQFALCHSIYRVNLKQSGAKSHVNCSVARKERCVAREFNCRVRSRGSCRGWNDTHKSLNTAIIVKKRSVIADLEIKSNNLEHRQLKERFHRCSEISQHPLYLLAQHFVQTFV